MSGKDVCTACLRFPAFLILGAGTITLSDWLDQIYHGWCQNLAEKAEILRFLTLSESLRFLLPLLQSTWGSTAVYTHLFTAGVTLSFSVWR